jgi:integrase
MSYGPRLTRPSSGSIKVSTVLILSPFLRTEKPEKLGVKAIERNLSQHANGTFYLVARRNGKLEVRSLKTKDLKEARRLLRDFGVHGLLAPREPWAVPPGEPPQPSPPPAVHLHATVPPAGPPAQPVIPTPTLAEALASHRRSMALTSKGAEEMADRCTRVVLEKALDWQNFDPAAVWTAYRNGGRKGSKRKNEDGNPVPLGSASNHMRWFLRSFVPWSVKKGYLGADAMESLNSIKKIKVNSREIRVPSIEDVGQFLAMIESEDPEGGAFVRFLACSGLRRGGALGLTWDRVDFEQGRMRVMQKGGTLKSCPLTPDAMIVLRARKSQGLARPFVFTPSELDKLKRKLQRFAKGFDLDLKYYHAFRHYFASQALIAGMSPKDVAELLGHSDGGVLVLKTYGHLCNNHLQQAVSSLKLVG